LPPSSFTPCQPPQQQFLFLLLPSFLPLPHSFFLVAGWISQAFSFAIIHGHKKKFFCTLGKAGGAEESRFRRIDRSVDRHTDREQFKVNKLLLLDIVTTLIKAAQKKGWKKKAIKKKKPKKMTPPKKKKQE
jgi:hypothetical protein